MSDGPSGSSGATDVVSERGDEAGERVRELTDGFGVHSVLECVGLEQSMRTALNIAPPGGAVGRVGLPQEEREDVRMSVLSGGTWRSRSRASPSESAENVRIDVVLEANVGQGA